MCREDEENVERKTTTQFAVTDVPRSEFEETGVGQSTRQRAFLEAEIERSSADDDDGHRTP